MDLQWYKNKEFAIKSGSNAWFGSVNMAETAIFTMIKGKIRICNGKIFRRMNFLTMRKAILRVFMVKLCQGRREETCEPFFVALMDVFHEPVFACVHIFVIPEGARF